MGVNTLRNRNANGVITQLDLTDAAAANRRFDVALGAKGADKSGLRFLGFDWVKSAGQAVTVTVSKIDTANGSKETILEGPVNDGGETTGSWRPTAEEMAGMDPEAPTTTGITYRLQFSQAGGACMCDPTATFKGI